MKLVTVVTDHGSDQRWMTSVSPSTMTMPTASSWIEHYFPNYSSGGPHTPFSPPSHGQLIIVINCLAPL